MNLVLSNSEVEDREFADAGYRFLGAADGPEGEVHVFLKDNASLAVNYVKIRIKDSITGMAFPFQEAVGDLKKKNIKFIKEFFGEEFQAVKDGQYYVLRNGYRVHNVNAQLISSGEQNGTNT